MKSLARNEQSWWRRFARVGVVMAAVGAMALAQNAAAPAFTGSPSMGSLLSTPGLWSAQFAETLAAGTASAGVYVQRYSRNPGAEVFTDIQSGWTIGLTSRLELTFDTTAGRRLRVNEPGELSWAGPGGNLSNVNPLAPFAASPLQWGPVGWTLGLTGNLLSQERGDKIGVALQFLAEEPYVTGANRLLYYGVDSGQSTYTGNLLLDKWVGNAGEIVANIGIAHTTAIDKPGLPTADFGSNVLWSYGVVFPRQARLEGIVELNGNVPFGGDEDINYFGPTTPMDSTWGVRLYATDWLALNAAYRLADHQPNVNSSGFVFGISMGPPAAAPPPPPPPAPPTMSCSVDQNVVAPGTTVHITGTPAPQGPAYTYTWTATGGRVSPDGATATWDTTGVGPGMYTITGHIANANGAGGSCSSEVEVREPPRHPPTVTCTANPTSVQPGASVSLTATGTSPDQRALTYSWRTSAGQLSASDQATTNLDTTGTTGTITATATVTDDRGLTGNCTADVAVQQPPPPPQASLANTLQFKPNSSRVDNAAKAALDDIALRLQQDAGATAVIVGYATTTEVNGRRPISDAAATRLAEERAVNAKAYLVQEKGISDSRISVREDTSTPGKAEVWIVPQGATYSGPGQPFDESAVKPSPTRSGGH